jgi:hypothetical protein
MMSAGIPLLPLPSFIAWSRKIFYSYRLNVVIVNNIPKKGTDRRLKDTEGNLPEAEKPQFVADTKGLSPWGLLSVASV